MKLTLVILLLTGIASSGEWLSCHAFKIVFYSQPAHSNLDSLNNDASPKSQGRRKQDGELSTCVFRVQKNVVSYYTKLPKMLRLYEFQPFQMLLENSDGRDLTVRELKAKTPCGEDNPCRGNKICQDGVCTRLPNTDKGKCRPSWHPLAVDEIASTFLYILTSSWLAFVSILQIHLPLELPNPRKVSVGQVATCSPLMRLSGHSCTF